MIHGANNITRSTLYLYELCPQPACFQRQCTHSVLALQPLPPSFPFSDGKKRKEEEKKEKKDDIV